MHLHPLYTRAVSGPVRCVVCICGPFFEVLVVGEVCEHLHPLYTRRFQGLFNVSVGRLNLWSVF